MRGNKPTFVADDPRLGSIIQTLEAPTDDFPENSIVLVGFPYDEGTVRNGGRGGSYTGPETFWHHGKLCIENGKWEVIFFTFST